MEKTPTFRVQPFGNYYLLERIAVGGMAEIFKAKQLGVRGFEKILVIKKILHHLSEDPEFVEMFEDEAKIAAQLTQANIVQIYELGEVESTLYITMEYVEGKNLRDITRNCSHRGIHLSVEQCVFLMIEVLKGLDYAHRKTDSSGNPLVIIHRDMSPQNIIASYEGEVKILDFGIAKAASKISKTEAGVLKGKFSYMSPEQASGRSIDQSTDVYACGVILHELLTSDRLFRAKTDLETLERVKEGHVDPPSQKNSLVPSDLDAIVLKALAKRQADRYTSASEMLNDLSQLTATHQFRYNSQDLAGFMKSLFSSTISEERERLIEHLKQIPPVISPSDQIMNARTNISFKRMPPIEDEKLPSEPKKKEEFTSTASKRLSPSKLPSAKVILSVALILIAGFYFLKMPNPPQKETTPTEQPTSKGQEPSALPMISQIPIIEITPTPNDMPRVDQVFGEVSPPPPEDIPMTKKSSPTPTPSPVEVKRTPRPTLRPKAFGSIDMMAPPEGFAELSIDGKPYGSVPGPKARDIRLEQGFHEFKCTTSKKSYSGRIEILPHESQIIRCEDLVVKD